MTGYAEIIAPAELFARSLALREIGEIADYCTRTAGQLAGVFAHGGGSAWVEHYSEGGTPAPRVPSALPWAWAGQHGRDVFARPESGRCFDAGGYHLLAFVYEHQYLLGCAGVSRARGTGDFTAAELHAFKMLSPFLQAGMLESARYTRLKLLGPDLAVILENHPHAVFLFDERDALVYANYPAKMRMQEERPAARSSAVAPSAALLPQIVAQKHLRFARLSGGQTATIVPLREWPELGLRNAWLALTGAKPAELPLSEREVEVIRTYAQTEGAAAGAAQLGIAEPTFRTHLKKIAGKLGVSGSHAALTTWFLNRQMKA